MDIGDFLGGIMVGAFLMIVCIFGALESGSMKYTIKSDNPIVVERVLMENDTNRLIERNTCNSYKIDTLMIGR